MWIVACATCGEQFAPKRSDAQYCSAACKHIALANGDKRTKARPKAVSRNDTTA